MSKASANQISINMPLLHLYFALNLVQFTEFSTVQSFADIDEIAV